VKHIAVSLGIYVSGLFFCLCSFFMCRMTSDTSSSGLDNGPD